MLELAFVVLLPIPSFVQEQGSRADDGDDRAIVERGLDWLKRHQAKDGRFSCFSFPRQCQEQPACTGTGVPVNDVGATGLALLAYLSAGSTLREGPHKQGVRRAVLWLKDQVARNGLIGSDAGHSFQYNHAIASIALIEAYRLSRYITLQPYAQKCVGYIERARNPDKVWRYSPRDGENDSSVTAWMALALVAAKRAKLKVGDEALKFARLWYDDVTDPETGRAGYRERGEPSSRPTGLEDRFPPERSEALTAASLAVRLALAIDPRTNRVLFKSARLLAKRSPEWKPKDGRVDFYYWFLGSLANAELGGEYRSRWHGHVVVALDAGQRKTGDARGSWDPVGPWGAAGGRVCSTALAVLSLVQSSGDSCILR